MYNDLCPKKAQLALRSILLEDSVIVVMLKEKSTGFLGKELACCAVNKHDDLLLNIFAQEEPEGTRIVLRLTCERDVKDWEFDAIFDYYDESVFDSLAISFSEIADCMNPSWELVFDYDESTLEEKINLLLETHAKELADVYDSIKDKKSDYI